MLSLLQTLYAVKIVTCVKFNNHFFIPLQKENITNNGQIPVGEKGKEPKEDCKTDPSGEWMLKCVFDSVRPWSFYLIAYIYCG